MSIWSSVSEVGETVRGDTDGTVLKYGNSNIHPASQLEYGTVALAIIADPDTDRVEPFTRLTLTHADPDWGGNQMATTSDVVLTVAGVKRLRRQLRKVLLLIDKGVSGCQ